MNLGKNTKTGALSTANKVTSGAWVVTFLPQDLPTREAIEIWHGAARGPGGYFLVYIDDDLFGAGQNGRINEYSPAQPMYVVKGQTVSLHWSVATTPAPKVTLWFREPEVGRI